jgi:Zn-dependent peptidase ImmA (M78 family)
VISKMRRMEVGRTAEDVVIDAKVLPIDPTAIAKSRGILVKAMMATQPGISGFLMKRGDAFGIGYSTTLNNPGFVNFTIGHELGHYFLPGHPEKLFATGSGTHESRSGFICKDPCELEADLFAASLLMPNLLFTKALREVGQGFPAIEQLSQRCVTSVTATAIRYSELAEDPVAVVVSSNGLVEYCCLSPAILELTGIIWLKRGDSIPDTTTTATFQKDPENITGGCQADGTSMLDEWLDGAPRIEMKEDVVGLGHYGKTLTVLFTDEVIEQEDPDEPEDTYEHWEKRR